MRLTLSDDEIFELEDAIYTTLTDTRDLRDEGGMDEDEANEKIAVLSPLYIRISGHGNRIRARQQAEWEAQRRVA